MDGSKLNKKFQGAVRSGSRRAAGGVRSAIQRMRIWQKAGLALCLVSWVVSAVIGAVCGRIAGGMTEQNAASRWSPDRESAQISTFFSGASALSDERAASLYSNYMRKLQEDSYVLSETQIENGASLVDTCYCGIGTADISAGEESVTVTMIGVGGDFFNFHPLELLDGYYFSEDDLMQDRILLDDETAWRLFGSPHITGQAVTIGGTPHYIAGVFRRPEGKFYKYAGMGSFMAFISYDSLCRYTTSGSPSEDGGDGGDSDMDMMDAAVPADRTVSSLSEPVEADLPLSLPSVAAQPPIEKIMIFSSQEEEEEEEEEEEPAGRPSAGAEKEEEDTEEAPEEDSDMPGAEDRGAGGSFSPDEEEAETPRVEINRNRISCYEVILPNPVTGYAFRMVRNCLTESGVAVDQITVVENTSRYDTFRLAAMVLEPGVRSMQTAAIRYPYWENVALAWEDVLIPCALLQLFLRYAPLLFLLFLLLWYSTHKSWTLAGIVRSVQDRIYDRQSERIYGEHPAQAVGAADTPEGLSAGAADASEGLSLSAGAADASEELSAGAADAPEGSTLSAGAADASEGLSLSAGAADTPEGQPEQPSSGEMQEEAGGGQPEQAGKEDVPEKPGGGPP